MAAFTLLSFATILSLLASLLLITFHFPTAYSSVEPEEEHDGFFVIDEPFPSLRSRSRFLTGVVQKGARCEPNSKRNICNGVSANNGTSLLNCCNANCCDLLGDKNNCGKCSQMCKFGELCCNGKCTDIVYDEKNCGGCNQRCPHRRKCSYGICGYA